MRESAPLSVICTRDILLMEAAIVPAMKKTAFLLTVLILTAGSAFAGSGEFGVIFGGSKRVTDDDPAATGAELVDEGFSLSNDTVDLYYAIEIDPSTYFKIRAGRINGPIGFKEVELRGPETVEVRRDVEGEVQHVEGIVEYRFDEPFGSTGLFAGIGAYRHEAEGFKSATDYGFVVGLNGDFPLSRRYGVIVDAAYHFTKHDFEPRYLTIGAGLRIAF